MKNIVRLASVFTLLPVAAGIAWAQTTNATAEAAAASSALSPVDYNFVRIDAEATKPRRTSRQERTERVVAVAGLMPGSAALPQSRKPQ